VVGGSFEHLFHTVANAIGTVVIVGAAGAVVGRLARVIHDRLFSP
jgi:ribosomal protein L13